MSELIDNILIDRKYELSINVSGGWMDGVNWMPKYSYSIRLLDVTLKSSKTYKRYDGAKKAARNLTHKLENKGG